MLILVAELTVLLVIPALLGFVWVDFVRFPQMNLQSWRRSFGLTALLLTSSAWAVAFLLDVVGIWQLASHNFDFRLGGLLWLDMHMSKILTLVAVPLALFFKGKLRHQTVFASLLMFLCWPIGYA